ncbi:hypothetical protein AALA22_08845 [Anaerovoracaceae bacterium 41-7]
MEIRFVITQKDVDRYNEKYFKDHPRAKNRRIKSPSHPTLNWYMTANNLEVNNTKQAWKDFIIELLEEKQLQNMQIDQCDIAYITYFSDKRKRDVDNITPKFIFDGFTEAGFIVADDYFHIRSLTTICKYDKDNPRIEIIVTT